MAEKEKTGLIKLQIAAGQANPAPPVGPALGQHGVNIMDFCNAFNDATKELQGMLTPVIITVYKDRSFTFETKSPPASTLIMKELKKVNFPLLNTTILNFLWDTTQNKQFFCFNSLFSLNSFFSNDEL